MKPLTGLSISIFIFGFLTGVFLIEGIVADHFNLILAALSLISGLYWIYKIEQLK